MSAAFSMRPISLQPHHFPLTLFYLSPFLSLTFVRCPLLSSADSHTRIVCTLFPAPARSAACEKPRLLWLNVWWAASGQANYPKIRVRRQRLECFSEPMLCGRGFGRVGPLLEGVAGPTQHSSALLRPAPGRAEPGPATQGVAEAQEPPRPSPARTGQARLPGLLRPRSVFLAATKKFRHTRGWSPAPRAQPRGYRAGSSTARGPNALCKLPTRTAAAASAAANAAGWQTTAAGPAGYSELRRWIGGRRRKGSALHLKTPISLSTHYITSGTLPSFGAQPGGPEPASDQLPYEITRI